jgi:hypothetical protein
MNGPLEGRERHKMIGFYKDDSGVVMYKDDTYLETDKFVIERPATDDDVAAHPDEHVAFLAATTPAPVEPVASDPTPSSTE